MTNLCLTFLLTRTASRWTISGRPSETASRRRRASCASCSGATLSPCADDPLPSEGSAASSVPTSPRTSWTRTAWTTSCAATKWRTRVTRSATTESASQYSPRPTTATPWVTRVPSLPWGARPPKRWSRSLRPTKQCPIPTSSRWPTPTPYSVCSCESWQSNLLRNKETSFTIILLFFFVLRASK